MIVNIPDERPYNVRIGADVLDGLGNYLRRVDATGTVEEVAGRLADALADLLPDLAGEDR